MSNALHDYARLFERYAANNGGTGAILAGEDCLAIANEMRMDADAIDAENAKLQESLNKLQESLKMGLNDELRMRIASLNAAYRRIKSKRDQLKAENAKLRRLLRLIFDEDYGDEFTELMCDLRVEETE